MVNFIITEIIENIAQIYNCVLLNFYKYILTILPFRN